ncbi:YceD family protein [Lolliginicoccus lacisalsi]
MKSSQHGPARPDANAPFVLDARSLGRKPGSMREVHRVVAAPERLGLDMIAIPEGSDVTIDVRLESVSEGVLVTGSVSAVAVGDCVRCLEQTEQHVEVPLVELFAYPNSTTSQTTEDDEVQLLVEDLIDLAPVVVNGLGDELPLQPVCSEDCPGLCTECGVPLSSAEPGHGHDTIDPRWAALLDKRDGMDSPRS